MNYAKMLTEDGHKENKTNESIQIVQTYKRLTEKSS